MNPLILISHKPRTAGAFFMERSKIELLDVEIENNDDEAEG